MEDLCAELMRLEELLVHGLRLLMEKILNDPAKPQSMKVIAQHECDDLADIFHQMQEVLRGDHRYHEKYPEDRHLTRHWLGCIDFFCDYSRSGDPELVQWARDSLKRIEDQSLNVQAQLIESAGLVKLSPEIRSAIQHKWIKLEEGLAMLDREFSTSTRCQTWYVST